MLLTFVYASGITLYLKDLLSYSSYNRSAEAVPFPDIPTAYWIIPSITVSLFYKNDILLNVSLHIFRNPGICGIYIQYVCKCQILVDFHPDFRTLRSVFPFWLFPDYWSSLRQRSLTSQELTFAVPLTYWWSTETILSMGLTSCFLSLIWSNRWSTIQSLFSQINILLRFFLNLFWMVL